ncbi:hypothetical protein AB0K04_21290 [Micromonospora coxensis]|uniref:hypothetical protein n=1 Tax=Micromonospora coxensis TaxID=356852 RepID=UPI0034249466
MRRILIVGNSGAGKSTLARSVARRLDLPDGCPERLDLDFLRYVPRCPRRSRPRVLAAVAAHAPALPVVRLRSRRQVDRWRESLPVA